MRRTCSAHRIVHAYGRRCRAIIAVAAGAQRTAARPKSSDNRYSQASKPESALRSGTHGSEECLARCGCDALRQDLRHRNCK